MCFLRRSAPGGFEWGWGLWNSAYHPCSDSCEYDIGLADTMGAFFAGVAQIVHILPGEGVGWWWDEAIDRGVGWLHHDTRA